MAEGAHLAHPPTDRRARFRKLREQLEPASDPSLAVSRGFYVERAGAVSRRIGAELELDPSSSHVLIGGVGSGKTTELLMAAQHLAQTGDTRPVFIDVSRRHDIGKMKPAVVALQVGLELVALARSEGIKELGGADDSLLNVAHGYWDYPDQDDYEPYPREYTPGMLESADPIDERLAGILRSVQAVIGALKPVGPHFVVLVDGLDRMTDLKAFEQVVRQDVQGLKSLGIGLVLAGPLRALYGIDRTLLDRFDRFHYQPWLDVTADAESRDVLRDLLQRRLSSDELDEDAREALIEHSGGVARDLLALAQSACVEAYLSGASTIGLEQVILAIDTFGRKHMQGLRPGELEVLERVRSSGEFVGTSEDDLGLLMTRRVLEYRSAQEQPRYVVHPTVKHFVAVFGQGHK